MLGHNFSRPWTSALFKKLKTPAGRSDLGITLVIAIVAIIYSPLELRRKE